jgi:hypothetical protein
MFARRFLLRRTAPSLVLVLALLVLALLGTGLAARDASPRSSQVAAEPVELFAAIQSGQIETKLVPRDSELVTLQVANPSDKPLTIKLPAAFAGLPVLAQQPPLFPPLPNPAGNQNPQILGGPFNGPNAVNRGGIFNVPPGKVIRLRLPCVCLEYGKPVPHARIPYELRPLESATGKTEVRELLVLFGEGKFSQRVTQIAAWHLANDVTWEELENLRVKHLNGRSERRFSPDEIERAKAMVNQLPSRQRGPSKGDSVSARSP